MEKKKSPRKIKIRPCNSKDRPPIIALRIYNVIFPMRIEHVKSDTPVTYDKQHNFITVSLSAPGGINKRDYVGSTLPLCGESSVLNINILDGMYGLLAPLGTKAVRGFNTIYGH